MGTGLEIKVVCGEEGKGGAQVQIQTGSSNLVLTTNLSQVPFVNGIRLLTLSKSERPISS